VYAKREVRVPLACRKHNNKQFVCQAQQQAMFMSSTSTSIVYAKREVRVPLACRKHNKGGSLLQSVASA